MSWGRPFGAVPSAVRIHRNNADLGIGEAPPPPRTSPSRRRRWYNFWFSPEPRNAPLSTLDCLDGLS